MPAVAVVATDAAVDAPDVEGADIVAKTGVVATIGLVPSENGAGP